MDQRFVTVTVGTSECPTDVNVSIEMVLDITLPGVYLKVSYVTYLCFISILFISFRCMNTGKLYVHTLYSKNSSLSVYYYLCIANEVLEVLDTLRLSVCLLAGYLKKLLTHLNQI